MQKQSARVPKSMSHWPLFFASKKNIPRDAEGNYLFKLDDDFQLQTSVVPQKYDYTVLLQLLLISQKQSWDPVITISRYELLKMTNHDTSSHGYARIKKSLRCWELTICEWKNVWFDGVEYSFASFKVIQKWKIDKETGSLKIFIEEDFIKKVRDSKFFQYLSIEEVQSLPTHTSVRLYEILKSYTPRLSVWRIDAFKLARKLPLFRDYLSQILKDLKRAVNSINKHTTLSVSMAVEKKSKGQATLAFCIKDHKSKQLQKAAHEESLEKEQIATDEQIRFDFSEKQKDSNDSELRKTVIWLKSKLHNANKSSHLPILLEKVVKGHFSDGLGGYDLQILQRFIDSVPED